MNGKEPLAMKQIQLDHSTCSGCHACVSKCPKGCITMDKDEWGFLYPSIDYEKCISCGLCIKICENVKKVPTCLDRKIYAVKHKEISVRKKSSSGGVFTALSNCILQNRGVVIGARYCDDMRVKHDFAKTEEERDAMRGSKYTYSLCDKSIFVKTKELLEKGIPVMFTGTPCQVSALKNYLAKDYEHLVLIDILCHGIAAPVLYEDYIDLLKKKHGEIYNIDFRYTPDGNWHDPRTQVAYRSGKKRNGELENSYFRMFVRNYCLRESCYHCDFAQFDRVSDITLGDFWGIEKVHKGFDSPHGVSVVLTNTQKGKILFEHASRDLIFIDCIEADCSHDQLNGLKKGGKNLNFAEDYKKLGYTFVHRKYTTTPISVRVRQKLYRVKLIKKLRDMIK